MDDVLLTPKEVAKILHVTSNTLATWRMKKINIPYIKMGHLIKYSKKDLDLFLKICKENNIKITRKKSKSKYYKPTNNYSDEYLDKFITSDFYSIEDLTKEWI